MDTTISLIKFKLLHWFLDTEDEGVAHLFLLEIHTK